jgi:hypothetical protein
MNDFCRCKLVTTLVQADPSGGSCCPFFAFARPTFRAVWPEGVQLNHEVGKRPVRLRWGRRDQWGTGDQESSHTRHCIPSKVMGKLVAMGRKNRVVATTQTVKATTTHGPTGWRLQRTQSQ